jgi:hypothetical protein
MAVASVAVTSPVLEVCLSHALSNETEEIIGLLLGDVSSLCPQFGDAQAALNGREKGRGRHPAGERGSGPHGREGRRKG